MYTKEDFLRDYPDRQMEPGLFEWLEELAQKKHQQGIEQGIEQGKLALFHTLSSILNHRLSEMPADVAAQLRLCTLGQLDSLVNVALDAATWEAFTTHLPPPSDKNEA